MGHRFVQQRLADLSGRAQLSEGRSDLLENFVSRRGNQFKAWLQMDEKGKVTFEFPEREGT